MGKIIEGFKTSTQAAHEISKSNFKAEKDAAKARHDSATEPHPGMKEFKEGKGLKGKAKAAIKGMKESTLKTQEAEKQRRHDAIHLTATKEFLEEERERREKRISVGIGTK